MFDLQKIARKSYHDANLYIFITGSKECGASGLAPMGSLCDSLRDRKTPIVRFIQKLSEKPKNGGNDTVCENAFVCTGQVIYS